MTWITPLLVLTSGFVTVAPLTITVSFTVNESGFPSMACVDMQSDSALEGTSPATT